MIEWTKRFERDYSIQYCENIRYLISKSSGDFIIYPVENIVTYRGGHRNVGFYAPAQEFEKHMEALWKFYSNIENSKQFLKEFVKIGKRYVEIAKKTGKTTNPKEFSAVYKEYLHQWNIYTSALNVGYELNDLFADKLCEFIEAKYEKVKPETSLNRLLAAVLKPIKTAATVQVGIDAAKIKRNYSQQALEKFQKKYEWINCLDLKYEPLSLEAAKKMVEDSQEVEQGQKQADVARELKLSKEEQEFVEVARTYFYVKDLRDEFRRIGVFHVMPFYKALSRELGVSYSQAYSLTSEETLAGLAGKKIDLKEANARLKDKFILYTENGKIKVLTGEKAVQKASELGIKTEEKTAEDDVVKGIAASPGVAKGKVRKIKAAAHLNRVQKGEILVAVTTNPNYMSAMNLASAIVTDEGGLTSHAAIVSRELKKPCVVGAKVATKLLNDGDEVEVDGTKGTVRKLG